MDIMNRIKWFGLVVILLATLTASCSKKRQLEGSWQINTYMINDVVDENMSGHTWTFWGSGACEYDLGDVHKGQWDCNGKELMIITSEPANIYSIILDFTMVELKNNTLRLRGGYSFDKPGVEDDKSGSLNITFTR